MSKKSLEFSRGDILADKYEVIDLLDESPLGPTYRVKHLESGKFVRLCLLRPAIANAEKKSDIIQAFKTARGLQHEHLLKIGELGDHDGIAYFTMEDFEGSTLRELLQEYKIEGKQFALEEASQIVIQVLEALQAIHDAGNVFRALRPEYVLVDVRYAGPRQTFVARVKLFGTAFWDLVPAGTLAEDEFTRGEAQYIAPELKSFEPHPTPRSDVYSAGVMFYEMLTGTAPVGTFQQPTKLRDSLPRHVDDIIELALANAPEDRYRTATDLKLDIRRIFQDPDLREDDRRPLITPVGWGLGLLMVIAVAAVLYQTRTDPVAEAEQADAEVRAQVQKGLVYPSPDEVRALLERHPQNMIYVPAGPFVSGRLHSETDAPRFEPLAEVRTTDAYLIDAFEYPNLKDAQPTNEVSFAEAERLCDEAGKRLCTAHEWEKACKGPKNTVYQYGDYYDPEYCGEGLEDKGYPSGSHEKCRSRWGPGPFDMSGNYREWTGTAPPGKDLRRIVKGGLRGNPVKGSRCGFFTDESVSFQDSTMSFRCCRDVDAPPVEPTGEDQAPTGEQE